MDTVDSKHNGHKLPRDIDIAELKLSQTIEESYAARRIYWPAYTWPVQTSYSGIIAKNEVELSTRLPKINKDALTNHVGDLFNKVNATFYHLQQLKASEKKAVEIGVKLASVSPSGFEKSIGIAGSYYEPTQYEYEALLTSAKTALDILAIIISKCFGRKEDNIVALFNNLNQASKVSPIETQFKDLFNQPANASFIALFSREVSRRNYAVHAGSLPIGTINVPINNPRASIIKSKAHDPHKPILGQIRGTHKAADLDDYCEGTFYSMADIVVDCLSLLLNTKFEKGTKASLQDERMRQ
jgi:hypothetical protein